MPNRMNLVKDMLPGAIRKTERDTYVFDLDGERHVHGSFRSAATDLAKAVNLEAGPDVASIWRRLGRPGEPHPPHQDALHRDAANGNEPSHGPSQGRRKAHRQQRSIKIELPQSVVGELLGRGRAKVILAVKR